jgi:hypothetical protein
MNSAAIPQREQDPVSDTPPSVISGRPYPVSAIGGNDPARLDDFLGEREFTIDMAGQPYAVQGVGSRLDDQVRFHEKSNHGKDVRVWHVTQAEAGFCAEHMAAF